MSDLPEPLVSAEVDLREFPFTPMFRARLFGSSFHARVTDSGWRAGVTLWLKSWDQVPAGTLPDDDVDLCRLAELGRDLRRWAKLRAEALWGWFKASDGRLHHPVVAEGVNSAWKGKCSQRNRTEAARLARAEKRLGQTGGDGATENVTDPETRHAASVTEEKSSVTDTVTGSKREGKGEREGKEEDPSLRSGSSADPPDRLNGHGLTSDDVGAAFDAWNALAADLGLPAAQRRTEPRRRSLAARLAECGGLDGWSAALAKVRDSAYLRGENDRGWRADLDFVLQAKSFTKLMEGSYDARKGPDGTPGGGAGGTPGRPADGLFAAFGKAARGAG